MLPNLLFNVLISSPPLGDLINANNVDSEISSQLKETASQLGFLYASFIVDFVVSNLQKPNKVDELNTVVAFH